MLVKRLLLITPLVVIALLVQAWFWVPSFDDPAATSDARPHKFIEVSIGDANPLPTPLRVPEPSHGVHHALCGNMWNTNYPFWYPFAPGERDATSQFRFTLELPI